MDTIIDRYIDAFKSAHLNEDITTRRQVEQFALDAGFDKHDVRSLIDESDECILRGDNYLAQKLAEPALAEFQKAHYVQPDSESLLEKLVAASLLFIRKTKDGETRHMAEEYINKGIDQYPSNTYFYKALKRLHSNKAPAIGIALMLFVGVLVASTIYYLMPMGAADTGYDDTVALESEKTQGAVETQASLDSKAKNIEIEMLVTDDDTSIEPGIPDRTSWKETGSDIQLSIKHNFDSKVVTLVPYSLVISDYGDSWSLEFNGLVYSDSKEVETLIAQAEIIDTKGNLVDAEKVDIIDYQPSMLPHETAAFDVLFYNDTPMPDLDYMKFTISQIESTPVIAVENGDEIPSDIDDYRSRDLSFYERENSYSEFFGEYTNSVVIRATNTGSRAIRHMKLILKAMDAKGRAIGRDDNYIVSSSEPPLLPGETRVARFYLKFDTDVEAFINGYFVEIESIE